MTEDATPDEMKTFILDSGSLAFWPATGRIGMSALLEKPQPLDAHIAAIWSKLTPADARLLAGMLMKYANDADVAQARDKMAAGPKSPIDYLRGEAP